MQTYLDAFQNFPDELKKEIASYAGEAMDPAVFVVPPPTCEACHPDQYRHWEKSPHKSSYQAVEAMGHESHPTCFRCHATGFRVTHGFILPPPPEGLRSINCEVCHGFLGNHLEDFINHTQGNLRVDKTKLRGLCTACHDEDRSPGFEERYREDLKAVICPPIDFSSPLVRSLYEKRDRENDRILKEKGAFAKADQYVKAAIVKKRLGAAPDRIISLLYKGFRLNENYKDLVTFLYRSLLEEKKPKEALDVMETYIAKNVKDEEINLEIIRLLTLARSPEVRDPEAAREYIYWFLANLDKKKVEVYLLLATANMQIGRPELLEEARAALETAGRNEPTPLEQERIRMLKKELIRRGTKR